MTIGQELGKGTVCFERLFMETYDYPKAEEVNQILFDLIQKSDKRSIQPEVVKAKMTSDLGQVKEVKDIIDWTSDIIHKDFLSYLKTTKKNVYCSDVWGNFYTYRDHAEPHHHAPAAYSWVYFVHAPNGSSPLIFLTNGVLVDPKPGRMVIFESRINHTVPPNNCHGRCILSGNFIHHHNNTTSTYYS